MIYELLRGYHRAKRYREISNHIVGIITAESQHRVDKTLMDAYAKATAQGADPEEIKKFNQGLIDKVNDHMSRENAVRIRQWTEAILEEEQKA
jgi:16S rRNA C1402 (ribose-2'-O) methylase RsmI